MPHPDHRMRIERCFHRLTMMSGFDVSSLSLKQLRKQVETELGIKMERVDKEWFKDLVGTKLQGMASNERKEQTSGSKNVNSGSGSLTRRGDEPALDAVYSIEDRLSMLIGYMDVPPAMGPRQVPAVLGAESAPLESSSGSGKRTSAARGAAIGSFYTADEWSRMNLQERSVAEKSRGDTLLQDGKNHSAARAYMQSQLLLIEHVGQTLQQKSKETGDTLVETDIQDTLLGIVKLLKFIARLFMNSELPREASAAHACCAVAHMMFVKARLDHYDLLRKDVSTGSSSKKDTKDMMVGVNSLFEALRSWESAVECYPADTPLQNWAVIPADEACRIIREEYLNVSLK